MSCGARKTAVELGDSHKKPRQGCGLPRLIHKAWLCILQIATKIHFWRTDVMAAWLKTVRQGSIPWFSLWVRKQLDQKLHSLKNLLISDLSNSPLTAPQTN